jgi:YD repeat-containing protein
MVTATNFIAEYAAGTNLNYFSVTATDVSGNSITNAYQLTVSANGLPTCFSYDKSGNQLVKSNANQVLTFGWDGADRCTAITNGNLRTILAYDGLNRWSRTGENRDHVNHEFFRVVPSTNAILSRQPIDRATRRSCASVVQR